MLNSFCQWLARQVLPATACKPMALRDLSLSRCRKGPQQPLAPPRHQSSHWMRLQVQQQPLMPPACARRIFRPAFQPPLLQS